MRHAILGAGGVGGLIGACLAKSGAEVTLVVRNDALSSYPKQLHLESPFGTFSAPVEVRSTVGDAEVVWITVKAPQLASALASFPENLPVRAIVPLLNGIDHVSLLREKYGAGRVIPATIAVESERVSPGHVVHRSPFARLNISAQGRGMLQDSVAYLQQLGFACQFLDHEPTLLWSKLVFLAPLALVSTATGKSTGEMVADPTSWQQIQDSVREACAVAGAEKAVVDAEAVIAMIRSIPGHMRSSMQKDVAQQKVPELDAIAGPILQGAARHGIDVPVTRQLVERVEHKVGQYQ
jgi:2-dehydropantoate 2-reductase